MRRLLTVAALVSGLAAAAQAEIRAEAPSVARYKLTAFFDWSRETHPFDFPANAHVSALIAADHSGRYFMFGDGRIASSGLELVAENGRTSILEAELAEATRRGRVGLVFRADGLANSPSVTSVEFDVEREHSQLSFVAMLEPSPDWFTGLASVELAPEDIWVDRLELPLWVWDAGTDSGAAYAAPNRDTQPRESIRLLASPCSWAVGA